MGIGHADRKARFPALPAPSFLQGLSEGDDDGKEKKKCSASN